MYYKMLECKFLHWKVTQRKMNGNKFKPLQIRSRWSGIGIVNPTLETNKFKPKNPILYVLSNFKGVDTPNLYIYMPFEENI